MPAVTSTVIPTGTTSGDRSKLISSTGTRNDYLDFKIPENLDNYLYFKKESANICYLISSSQKISVPCSAYLNLKNFSVSKEGNIGYFLKNSNALDDDLYLNASKIGTYRTVQQTGFNSQGKLISKVFTTDLKTLILEDFQPVEPVKCDPVDLIFISPDLPFVNYTCHNGQYTLILNNASLILSDTNKDSIVYFTIAPNGNDFAYIKNLPSKNDGGGDSGILMNDRFDSISTITHNNKESKQYNLINYVSFSPDSDHLSYVGLSRQGDNQITAELVIDNTIVKSITIPEIPTDNKYISQLIYAGDNSTYAYAVRQENGEWQLFVNNEDKETYPVISNFVFNQDATHYAFVSVPKKDASVFPVLDAEIENDKNPHPDLDIYVDGKFYKSILPVGRLKFEGNNNLEYYGFRNNEFWFNVDHIN